MSETTTIDKLYLELAQFTGAKTAQELRLDAENARLRKALDGLLGDAVYYFHTDMTCKCWWCSKNRSAIAAAREALNPQNAL